MGDSVLENRGKSKAKSSSLRVNEDKKTVPVFVKYGLIAVAAIIVIAIGLVIYFNMAGSYVATFDGKRIKTDEFKYYLELQKQTMYSNALMVDQNISKDTFWATKIGGEDAMEVAKKKALDMLKDTKMQYKKAKEAKISMTEEEMTNLNDYIQSDIIIPMGEGNKIKANKAFEKEYGFSIDALKEAFIQNTVARKYMQQEVVKIPDADADIETYYNKNLDWYKEDTSLRSNGEEAVWARHILIMADENATQEEKDAAKKKAEDLIARLKAGEDFAALVGEYSEDGGSNGRGGDYMFGKSATFYTEFKDAAFALEPGKFTETPIQTGAGYHIIRVDEKYAEGEPVSLKCAKEYYEYGTMFVKYYIYLEKVAEWVKNARFELNASVYDSIRCTIP